MDKEKRNGVGREVLRTELYIPVKNLTHNIPVDPTHVQTLVRSIEQSGQLSPLLVWDQNNQVIDGFHRLEALRTLRVSEAWCNLVECSEEEFRDARITSAVIHKGVVFPRVVKWATEAFAQTKWNEKINAIQAFKLDHQTQFPKGYRKALREGFTKEEIEEVLDWVRTKSKIWGLKPLQITNMLGLAEFSSPLAVSWVGSSQVEGRIFTRTMLRSIAERIPDHVAQETLTFKAIQEGLNEDEVKALVHRFKNAASDEEQATIFTTSWRELTYKPKTIRILTPEESRELEKKQREENEVSTIKSVIFDLKQVAEKLPNLPIENHPSFRSQLREAIEAVLLSIELSRGYPEDVINNLRLENNRLLEEVENLKAENKSLSRSLEALRRTLGIARRISDEESRLRE